MVNIETEITTLTPARCRELLGRNFDNRRVDQKVVDQYSRDISNGDWQLNGETISLDHDGNLINGQHRCLAIVKANRPVQTILVTGLPPKVKDTIDGGKKRTYGDRLKMRGYKNYSSLAGNITFMFQIASGNHKASLSAKEMDRVLETHPNLTESCALARSSFKGQATYLGAVHYIGTYLGYKAQADAFAQVMRDGQATYKNDAAVYYREFIYRDMVKAQRSTLDFRRRLFVATWNKFYKREPLTRARIPKQFSIKGWTTNELGL